MQNIIFDLGGVLIDWNPDNVYKQHFTGNLAKMQQFYQETGIHQANAEMDRGRPFQEALAELANKFPHHQKPIHMWQTHWCEMLAGPITDTVKILESLYKQKYPLFALTNWAAETFVHVRNNYNFFNYFKDIVVSGALGTIKPEPQIYKILLTRNRLDPKNSIFIDDNALNLPPAEKLGITTIQFSSPKQLHDALKLHNIKI